MDIVADATDDVPLIEDVTVSTDLVTFQRLDEGQFIDGRFKRNIRIDQATHVRGNGLAHAHVLGRKGNELVVVNVDGTGSHGSKGKLHPRDADALTAKGFTIRPDYIVEWWVITGVEPEVLFG